MPTTLNFSATIAASSGGTTTLNGALGQYVAPITLVQHGGGHSTSAASGTTFTVTLPAPATAGNFLILSVGIQSLSGLGPSITHITDDGLNGWTKVLSSSFNSSSSLGAIYYVRNCAPTSVITVTCKQSGLGHVFDVAEFGNIDPTAPLDVSSYQLRSSGSTADSLGVATTNSGELWWGSAWCGSGTPNLSTTSAGFTSFTQQKSTAANLGMVTRTAYDFVSSVGIAEYTASLSTVKTWMAAVVAIRQKAGDVPLMSPIAGDSSGSSTTLSGALHGSALGTTAWWSTSGTNFVDVTSTTIQVQGVGDSCLRNGAGNSGIMEDVWQFTGSLHKRALTAGKMITTKWKDIEPSRGNYVWDSILSQANAAVAAGKDFGVRISPYYPGPPNSGTPSWVLSSVSSVNNFNGDTIPVYWDPLYVTYCTELAAAVATFINSSAFAGLRPHLRWWQGTNGVYGESKVDAKQGQTTSQILNTWLAPGPSRTTSADGNTTSGSAVVTAADGAFTNADVGEGIRGSGIPGGTTILSVQSGTQATMSQNATATSTTVALSIYPPPYSDALWYATMQNSARMWRAAIPSDIPVAFEVEESSTTFLQGSRTVSADGVTTAGSAIVGSASALWSTADIGTFLQDSLGALPDGTTILSIRDSNHVNISQPATKTTTGDQFQIGFWPEVYADFLGANGLLLQNDGFSVGMTYNWTTQPVAFLAETSSTAHPYTDAVKEVWGMYLQDTYPVQHPLLFDTNISGSNSSLQALGFGMRPWSQPDAYLGAQAKSGGFNTVRLRISWANLEITAPVFNPAGSNWAHAWNQRYLTAIDAAIAQIQAAGCKVIIAMDQEGWSPAFHWINQSDGTIRPEGAGLPSWLYPSAGQYYSAGDNVTVSGTTLTDASIGATWTTNQWVGLTVSSPRGNGVITASGTNTITVASWTGQPPQNGDPYTVGRDYRQAKADFWTNTADPLAATSALTPTGGLILPQDGLVDVWKMIGQRYANNPTTIGMDLFNRPDPDSGYTTPSGIASALHALYQNIANAIRAQGATRAILMCQDSSWDSYHTFGALTLASGITDSNWCLAQHYAPPDPTTGSAGLTAIITKSGSLNVPLLLEGIDLYGFLKSQNHVAWSMYVPGSPGDNLVAYLAEEQKVSGPNVASAPVVMWYGNWGGTGSAFPVTAMDAIRNAGKVPMNSWASTTPGSPGAFPLASIAAGTYDAYLNTWFTAAAAWGHPFYLRFDYEMNGPWMEWGNDTANFVAAWQHVHAVAVANGATNIIWVWAPNITFGGAAPMASFYPGDSYVDIIGLDGYNRNTPWTSFHGLFNASVTEALACASSPKPLWFTEVGCVEDPLDLSRKGAWITDMLQNLTGDFPQCIGFTWFDTSDGTYDYSVTTSPAAQGAFVRNLPLFSSIIPTFDANWQAHATSLFTTLAAAPASWIADDYGGTLSSLTWPVGTTNWKPDALATLQTAVALSPPVPLPPPSFNAVSTISATLSIAAAQNTLSAEIDCSSDVAVQAQNRVGPLVVEPSPGIPGWPYLPQVHAQPTTVVFTDLQIAEATTPPTE